MKKNVHNFNFFHQRQSLQFFLAKVKPACPNIFFQHFCQSGIALHVTHHHTIAVYVKADFSELKCRCGVCYQCVHLL